MYLSVKRAVIVDFVIFAALGGIGYFLITFETVFGIAMLFPELIFFVCFLLALFFSSRVRRWFSTLDYADSQSVVGWSFFLGAIFSAITRSSFNFERYGFYLI